MTDNQQQAEFWSNARSWITYQAALDTAFAPVLDMILDAAPVRQGDKVLDIGCGTGASLMALAQHHDFNIGAHGIDISEPFLEMARSRIKGTQGLSVAHSDAQIDDLGGPYDAVISRFGVMFFSDTVAAFANIKRALRRGASLTLAAWGPAPQNPWFMMPARVAREVIGTPPKTDRTLPGPFAFEDAARVQNMLDAAGLRDVKVTPVDIYMTPPGTAEDFADLCLAIGPADSIARHFDADESARKLLRSSLIEAARQFETGAGLRVPAHLHLITATA